MILTWKFNVPREAKLSLRRPFDMIHARLCVNNCDPNKRSLKIRQERLLIVFAIKKLDHLDGKIWKQPEAKFFFYFLNFQFIYFKHSQIIFFSNYLIHSFVKTFSVLNIYVRNSLVL